MGMGDNLTNVFTFGITVVEKILLVLICLATVIAIGIEVNHLVTAQIVLLSDILLMFIYLEVLAMSRFYVEQGRVPVRYPIYIAVIALARYLTLAMKEIQALDLFWIALTMVVLVIATLGLRVGHKYLPYERISQADEN